MARATIASARLGSSCALNPRLTIEYATTDPNSATSTTSHTKARIVALQLPLLAALAAFLNGMPRPGRRRCSFIEKSLSQPHAMVRRHSSTTA
jgi:hypothetical protein